MKKLNINIDIGINTALFYCFPLSIISAYPVYKNWIASNYIEIAGGTTQYENDLNSYRYYIDSYCFCDVYSVRDPVLIQNGVSSKILTGIDIHEIIRESINNDKYILLFVDEYYLPESASGNSEHRLHEQLIYGYCEAKRIYYAAGFNKDRQYALIEHDFDDMENAYKKGFFCDMHGNVNWVNDNRLISLAVPDNLSEYPLDRKYYAEKIRSYLSGRLDPKRDYFLSQKIKRCFYGISYYDMITEEIKDINKTGMFLHINHLRDHKYMLKNSMKIYADYQNNVEALILAEEFIKTFNSIDIIRSKLLKNKVSRRNTSNDVLNDIRQIKQKEYDLLSRYAEILLKN